MTWKFSRRKSASLAGSEESKYQILFESANDGLFILDKGGVILDVNRSGCERLGYKKTEMIGRRISEFDSPEFVPLVPKRIEDLYARGEARFESMHLHIDGSEMPVEINAKIVSLEGQQRIFSVIRDITERKKLEEKIFESESKFHTLFEFSRDFKLILSLNGIIKDINETCYKSLGYNKNELVGEKISKIIAPEFKSEIFARTELIKRKGSAIFESAYLCKNGDLIPIEASIKLVDIGGEKYQYGIARVISERMEMQKILRKNEQKYRAVIETLADGFWITDMQGRFIEVNDVYLNQSGYTRDEMLQMRIPDVEAKEKPEETGEHLEKLIREGHDRFESLHRKKNGEIWPVEIVTNFWKIGEGIIFVFIIDITKRKKAEEEVRLMASVFQNSGEAMLISDAHNRIQKVNPAFCELTGYSLEDVLGKDPKIVSAGRQTEEYYRELWERVLHEGRWQGEIWDRRKDGTEYPKWLSISTVKNDSGEIVNFIGNFSDITERKRAEAEILELAYHDTLTGLHNRHSLISHLDQELSRAKRTGNKTAIMFIDLDRFKAINDTLGHHVGDNLLIEVAARMRHSARESDIIARLGGDEFVIILLDIKSREDAQKVAEKLITVVSDNYDIEGHKIYTSPSIGISIFPDDGNEANIIMQRADMAMYFSKTEGGSQYRFYESDMNLSTTQRLSIENNLRNAIEKNELSLYFQPLISLDGKVKAAEALIRWNHPHLGLLSPDKFIPISEESNLILQIGQWVVASASKTLSKWIKLGYSDVLLAVNISAKEFLQENFPQKILDILKTSDVPPQLLELEVTESTAMKNPEKVFKIMNDLKASSIRLSIDDFGTGYSSLAYLARFPIDQLKIDRSFVRDIEKDKTVMAVTKATIALAKQLGKQVVAEGVENARQSDVMFANGCDLQQGYYFAKPVPEELFLEILNQRNRN